MSVPVEIWRRRMSARQWLFWLGWSALVVAFVAAFQFMTKNTIWAFVHDAPTQIADIGDRM